MVASAGETDRDFAGRQFPTNSQYYRVLTIINLKLYNVLECFIMFIVLNYNFYNIIKF
jgi:hypothetical protein